MKCGKGIQLTDEQFELLRRVASERWGLNITDRKRDLVNGRLTCLSRRNEGLDVESFLARIYKQGSAAESLVLFDVLSTNMTSFFRDPEHFRVLREEVVAKRCEAGVKRLRIWSAGCSAGCEPYSIAMLLTEAIKDLSAWDIRILATDLASSKLKEAKRGTYPARAMKDVDGSQLAQHFEVSPEGDYTVKQHLRDLITFGRVNLIEPWRMSGPFDAIFCRNVMIYFDGETKERLLERFRSLLAPDGLIFLGSAESITGTQARLRPVHPSVYRMAA